jgi:hypothetical protein
MARKYNGLRVGLDNVSGEVSLRIPYHELRQILTAASLNCYDAIEKARKASDAAQAGQKSETLAYHQGLLQYIKGVDLLIEAQGAHGAPRTLAQDPLTRKRSVKQRREYVQRAQKERRMLDDLLASVLANRSQKAV